MKRALTGVWDVRLLIGANDAVLGRWYSRYVNGFDFTFLYTANNKPLATWCQQHSGQALSAEARLEMLKENAPAYHITAGKTKRAQEIIQKTIFTIAGTFENNA